jgi:hypothetical protein
MFSCQVGQGIKKRENDARMPNSLKVKKIGNNGGGEL